MTKRTSIVNISGDEPETIIQLAKHLGTSAIRRKIFDTVYGRGTRPKSRKQIMEAAGISSRDKQQVQNQLNHLSSHHLIVRSENGGFVKDGDKYVYGKDETVRAHRKEIIKFADNPKAAAAVTTKRHPTLRGIVPVRQVSKRELKKRKHLTVLYLAANPDLTQPLRVDAEVRRVQEAIRGSKFSDNITVQYRPAADLNSLIDGLNDHRPQIVHFSGHGNEGEIATDSGKINASSIKPLSFDLLEKALSATDNPPKIVVLNSCKSSAAKKILLPTVTVLITMRASITDIAATAFAPRFYAAIASGQSVKAAFAQGKVAVEAVSISEADIPELIHRPSINPASIILT